MDMINLKIIDMLAGHRNEIYKVYQHVSKTEIWYISKICTCLQDLDIIYINIMNIVPGIYIIHIKIINMVAGKGYNIYNKDY